MSYGSSQDDATTVAHTKKILKWLHENTYIDITGGTIWEDKKYV